MMAAKLDAVHAANKALVQSRPLVAVFFGGTSGIGHYTLRELCRVTAENEGKGFRAYIIGRKADSAAEIIAECRGIYSEADCTFVQVGDLSLIHDVDKVCAEILRLEREHSGQDGAIDYLMLSQGGSIFLPRKDTKEGIDITMSLMYYSRMRIILKLLPLLLNSQLPATIVSVYVAGAEKQLFPEDLSLRDLTHYNYSQARSHMCYMHTLFFETLAKQHPGKLSLVHAFPGVVITPGFQSADLPARIRFFLSWVFIPLFGWLSVRHDVCAARFLSLASPRYPPGPGGDDASEDVVMATNGKRGGGSYSVTYTMENNYKAAAYEAFDKDEMREKVWEHTLRAFEVIESGEVFRE